MAPHSSISAWRIPTDRGAWWATVHGVTKSQTRLKWLHTHTHTHTKKVTFGCELEREMGIHKNRSWVPTRRQEVGWEKGRSVRRQDMRGKESGSEGSWEGRWEAVMAGSQCSAQEFVLYPIGEWVDESTNAFWKYQWRNKLLFPVFPEPKCQGFWNIYMLSLAEGLA